MTTTTALVPISQRLDFDALAPTFSRAVNSLDAACTAELDRAGIDLVLRELVRLRASQLNGCAYCVDMHSTAALKHGATAQRIHAVAIWEDSPFFTARERAALRLTEAITRLAETHVPRQGRRRRPRRVHRGRGRRDHRPRAHHQPLERDRRHHPVLGARPRQRLRRR